MCEEQPILHTPDWNRLTVDTERFRREVLAGLSLPQKSLPSKYFYDERGDILYNDIMDTGEYYLGRSEIEIFADRTGELTRAILERHDRFSLVELGPGDVRKSIYLISALYLDRVKFTYVPIDISPNVISFLSSSLPESLPGLPVQPMNGEYLEMLWAFSERDPAMPKVLLCLGGNVANMPPAETRKFCSQLRGCLNPGDMAIMGFDLKKNPHLIRAAYNDRAGITAAFNLNLLTRINRELGADFETRKFSHYCHYDPERGCCKSYLVCLEAMDVRIGDRVIHFDKDECIRMETSQKYSVPEINRLAESAGFSVVGNIYDGKKWFADSIWVAE
ncbi:MAG TPA: L-histidine N(alpha)-methyltransferase [Puia sp.]|uniref:L-histidine N(alpha)-methyltransferase n=1 Tax=Puia sp. TaxID=2045100 RepID=UPI002BA6AA50|nr:L-histidine N(alpha)-methyltransferase [Puia sp.]HVU97930.1 L-histidine N(alpha)-methyltransferase [Puia sp.]